MGKTLRPIVTVAAVDVQCPACNEFIASPSSGSLFFEINEYQAGAEVTCNCCSAVVKLPVIKSVRIK